MSQPTVSIVIPTKNRAALLRETVQSVLAQTYPHWEALIVDDGSTDNTAAAMMALAAREPRVRFLRRTSAQSGAPVCRNAGAATATGAYVIFLDSDDCLAPHCLQQRVAAMEAEPELDFGVFGCAVFVRQPGDQARLFNADKPEPDLDRLLALDVPWQTASPLWRRAALTRVGPWDEALPSLQDWEFHMRALVRGLRYRKFPDVDCYWRLPEAQADPISLKSSSPAHLRAQEEMFGRVEQMLASAGLLTPPRRESVAGLFFLIATRWTSVGWTREPTRIWRACCDRGLVGGKQYVLGWWFLVTRRIALARRLRALLPASWWQGILGVYRRRFRAFAGSPTQFTAPTASTLTTQAICAVIVTYHPDADFAERFARIAAQVGKVVIVDNRSDDAERERLRTLPAELILNDDNLGIATALNQGVRRARELGARFALLFDQDTVAGDNLAATLLRMYAPGVGIIGANYRDTLGRSPRAGDFAVITSGSLVPLDVFDAVGPFRDDYFIDSVDIEYCLRLRGAGYQVRQSAEPLMTHSIGAQTRHRFLWKDVACSNHSALRRYYITRNRLVLTRAWLWRQPRWALRHLRGLFNHCVLTMLYEQHKLQKFQAILLGVWHGLTGRMGKLERAPWIRPASHQHR